MGKGHGTDKAIVAGLLGLAPDDSRLRNEMEKSECSREEILEEMHSNLIVMRESIERGLDVSEKPHGLFTGGDAIKLMSYAKQSSMGADIEEKNGE